ncbi:MAG: hypothetical protein CL780_01920 [Chloroflexi bacterium]|nr:hypothetical protein [Chloroflexota bacterium]
MFQLSFNNKNIWSQELNEIKNIETNIKRSNIYKTMLINWEEHCLECAVPECYTTCHLYSKRSDGACQRFSYGIFPNKKFSGLFKFGADVRFKKWAKLEADLLQFNFSVSKNTHKFSQLLSIKSPKIFSKITKIYSDKNSVDSKIMGYDDFIIECYSDNKNTFNLILECYAEEGNNRRITFRRSFEIKKGLNNFHINTDEFIGIKFRYIYLYPENDLNTRLIFTWLDFIKYKNNLVRKRDAPSKKVKCVAWDLDNTLWEGILIESDPSKIFITSNVIETIKSLDQKGIIQTIVSKNDHDSVSEILKRNGLWDYFIYPAINWGQKSSNLKTIAKKINIDLNTFALIDDSHFERFEVNKQLPQVRTFSNQEINNLLTYPEFDLPITETSKIRRKSYMSQIKREKIQENFSGDYDDFLKSCKMKIEIFVPSTKEQKTRCFELFQRSNQLNLSGNKFSEEELNHILHNPNYLMIAINCSDKFGKYGIIGVINNKISEENWELTDFVLSCRVAQKKVEHHILEWLMILAKEKKKKIFIAKSVHTPKNEPLLKVFSDMKFKKNQNNHMLKNLENISKKYDLITLEDKLLRKN